MTVGGIGEGLDDATKNLAALGAWAHRARRADDLLVEYAGGEADQAAGGVRAADLLGLLGERDQAIGQEERTDRRFE